MRPRQPEPALLRFGSALVVVLVIAGCTPGGQFDPTTLFDSDTFTSKTKVKGQRELVFPNGVPGIETGVPPELVKGYQPPPDQAANDEATPGSAAQAATEPKPTPKAEPKPKPKLASVPAKPKDKAFEEKPPTRINIGLAPKSGAPTQPAGQHPASAQNAATQQATSSQSAWPPPPQTAPAQQGTDQSIWPAPPPTGRAQQAAQPDQSIWPNPPAPGTTSQ
jgi:hypothetical protein